MELNSIDFLSIKEFAYWVKLHPSTVRRAIKSGRLNAFRIGEGIRSVYRIPKTEVDRIALCGMQELIEKMIEKKMGNNL
jgi:excisionase family DNA binding protein